MSTVAVIGGGWAGCAAAVALARHGHRVTLYEAAPVLGGRARTVIRDGLPLDNGQHLLLGGYTATRALAATLHPDGAPLVRSPLAMAPLADGQSNALTLRARPWRAPLGLLAGLLTAHGLGMVDRLRTVRAFAGWERARFRCRDDATVADVLAAMPEAARTRLWEPLCIAALNTAPAAASGQVFLNVLAATFAGATDAADLVLPTVSLGEALPAAAGRFLATQGHVVRTSVTATVGVSACDRLHVATAATRDDVDAVVVAVGPHQLARAFAPALRAAHDVVAALRVVEPYAYESITTVYLGYRGPRLALPGGLVRLDDAPGQWLFPRDDILRGAAADAVALDQLVAVVISTNGPHDDAPQTALAAACDAQLRRLRPELAPLAWSRVIGERRATYACTPRLAAPPVRVRAGLYLAGDYVYPAFPATLEAAVRSGNAAADAVVADVDTHRTAARVG
jgi:squalene-associated FAD-dependent desaturase